MYIQNYYDCVGCDYQIGIVFIFVWMNDQFIKGVKVIVMGMRYGGGDRFQLEGSVGELELGCWDVEDKYQFGRED